MKRLLLIIIGLLSAIPTGVLAEPKLEKYETRYYTIYTDLPPESAMEVNVRMTRMAEEYHNRTREFSGQINEAMPFYLFRNQADYVAAGGDPRSAGIYTGQRLMALAGEQTGWGTWHTVQHEGFHQFAHHVIGGELPMWVNEGLAEYFGEALFNGEGYTVGLIPAYRLARLKQMIHENRYKSVEDMMLLTNDQWNNDLQLANYDQAWSMVQFLAHAADGKYQSAFAQFIKLVGQNRDWKNAWKQTFGDTVGFEKQWKQYWLSMNDNPTATQYGEATVTAMASFLSRATAEGQQFSNFQDFAAMGRRKQLKMPATDPLPPQVFIEMLDAGVKLGTFDLKKQKDGLPALTLTMKTGAKVTGRFSLRPTRQVFTEVAGEKRAAPRRAPAKF